jgi:hypothetical protein
MASDTNGIVATTNTWHHAASHIIANRMTGLIAPQQ